MSTLGHTSDTDAGAVSGSAAFFDLDGTLVVGHTQALLVVFLREAGIIGRLFVLGAALWFAGYKVGVLKVTERSRDRGAQMFKGLTEGEVEGLMERFTEEVMVPRLHPSVTSALAEHSAAGDRVVVISAALEPVVRALCRRLGVADHVGAQCELRDGRYTGRLIGPTPYAERKALVAAEFMERWGVDPLDCWAYADHDTDLALLHSIGHPVAVNPKPRLRQVALMSGWPVLP